MFKKLLEKLSIVKEKEERILVLINGIKLIKKLIKSSMTPKEVKELKKLCNELIKGE